MKGAAVPSLLVAVAVAVAAPAPVAAGTSLPPSPGITADLDAASTGVERTANASGEARLEKEQAIEAFLSHGKVADWLERYPPKPTTAASFVDETRSWRVDVWSGRAGQIATGRVDDASGRVLEAWTGPQVAWAMARGGSGAFGGRWINEAAVWLPLCLIFLIGLADLRRPLSMRNLDLLVLLSFAVSLYWFNRGDIFTSVPLVYPPLVYLIGRLVWIGVRGRPTRTARPLWPVWLLAAAAVFLTGFRIGLNIEDSNVIDVGYAGVIGAHRIANGEAPYGHMPLESENLEPCGAADAEGRIRERIQANGRCERSNERGDTYGPVSYAAYLPGFWLFGWTGRWDSLPAAHFTSIAFDLLCMLGLVLVGLRFGGARLAATLGFAWAAYPFTLYTLSSNTNDAILPAFLILGFWLVTSPWARGVTLALAGWTKFAALIVAPLWATYPRPRRAPGNVVRFAIGFMAATAAAFTTILLEPSVVDTARTFWDRTLGWQLGRDSPFSVWGWGQYHANGIPDLGAVQLVLEVALITAAVAVAFVPRAKTPLQLAALTGGLLAAFELVLTHWFYLYIPWFFPFAAFALLATATRPASQSPARTPDDDLQREPVPVG